MKVLYYITAHGHGHALRACTICRELPAETEIILRTNVEEEFFRQELSRPFRYAPAAFDCGCIQIDGVTIDRERTLQTYRAIAERNAAVLQEEARWCAENGIEVIVADIPPFAFEVAREARIPSVAATNFTWYDIYAPWAGEHPDFLPELRRMRAQYGMADLLLKLSPALPMPYFRRSAPAPVVGRRGRNVREEIIARYKLRSGAHLGLIYTGNFGMDRIPWKKIEAFADWDFLGLYPLPGDPANYRLIRKDFPYEDFIASAEAMISKLGYGAVAECLINGTPLVYLARNDFAESPALERAVLEWGGGYGLSEDEFQELRLEKFLRAPISGARPEPQRSDGARICAGEIVKLCNAERQKKM